MVTNDLRAYAGAYLETEIATEAAVRNIESFSRFLLVAATCNGQILNHTALGSDAKISRKTVAEYFEILCDTLIDYKMPHTSLHYWRSTSGFEVDFILGGEAAIEVKGKPEIGQREFLTGLWNGDYLSQRDEL